MRFGLAFVLSSALLFGCGDDGNAGTAGSGGSAGQGGTGAAGGEGGTGGLGFIGGSGTYVVVSPIPPCKEGVASNYSVDVSLAGAGIISPNFPECTGLPVGNDATITCPVDEPALDYSVLVARGGGTPGGETIDVDVSGTFEACSGLLIRDVTPSVNGVVVDVFVSPIPPCEQGLPSDYTVEVFVDGAPEPLAVSGDFPDCTGAVDSQLNTIACANADESLQYSMTIGEGDLQVSINGTWQTCTAFLSR
jgi:hypothetical protein